MFVSLPVLQAFVWSSQSLWLWWTWLWLRAPQSPGDDSAWHYTLLDCWTCLFLLSFHFVFSHFSIVRARDLRFLSSFSSFFISLLTSDKAMVCYHLIATTIYCVRVIIIIIYVWWNCCDVKYMVQYQYQCGDAHTTRQNNMLQDWDWDEDRFSSVQFQCVL